MTLIEIVFFVASFALGVLSARAVYAATASFWLSAAACFVALNWFSAIQLTRILARSRSELREFMREHVVYEAFLVLIALVSTLFYVQTGSFLAAMITSVVVFVVCIVVGWAACSMLKKPCEARTNEHTESGEGEH